MAKDKTSFLFYCDWKEIFESLPDNEQRGQLITHILRYVNDENPVSENPMINIGFAPIKSQLKRDLKKWENIREKRSAAGKASAIKRQQNQQVLTSVESVQQTSTKATVDVDVDVDVLHNPPIVPPLDEFMDYARGALEKRGLSYPEHEQSIILKYDAWKENGWRTGTDPPREIKNWKTTLLNTIPHLKKTEINGKHATNALAKSLRAARQNRIET